ncbi:MAG: ornithine cyclodeaminase family protein [Pseudonocardiaceae bacterium]|nr:MAG: ornithine cyclodeaminase family protein [Pseudonocardiaceae bacterium]
MLVLGKDDVAALLDPAALVDAVAVAMADLSAGRASAPHRIGAAVEDRGLLAAMPAYCPSLGLAAAKLLTVYPDNMVAGHPVHQATISTFDPVTGAPTAIMDGDLITAMRTAAASALSVRLLARPDARVLAVLGTGPQALEHLRLVTPERSFTEVRVAGRSRARAEKVAADAARIGIDAVVCGLDDAVPGADVVCSATSAVDPIVRAGDLVDGAHVTAVGFVPDGGETDPALYATSLVAVEHRDTTLRGWPIGAADLVRATDEGALRAEDVVELGELVAGTRTGRTDPRQRTVYRSVGVAVQDVAAASVVLRAAAERGVGRTVDL